MSRYQALRRIGCNPLTAGAIAFMNYLRDVPNDEVRFMHMTIEIEAAAPASPSKEGS